MYDHSTTYAIKEYFDKMRFMILGEIMARKQNMCDKGSIKRKLAQ